MKTERDLINTHDQLRAAGGGVAITVAYSSGRETYVSGWHVYRLGPDGKQIVTEAKGHFWDHGCKWFSLGMGRPGESFHEKKRRALAEAQAWVREQGWYDGEWKRNAVGDVVPADIQKRFPIPRRKKTI
jgi:hypothetical protein